MTHQGEAGVSRASPQDLESGRPTDVIQDMGRTIGSLLWWWWQDGGSSASGRHLG